MSTANVINKLRYNTFSLFFYLFLRLVNYFTIFAT